MAQREIKEFINGKIKYDSMGQYFWIVDKNGGSQMLAELRGWGAIQQLFKGKGGAIDMDAAGVFQDEIGEWIADAINQKLQLKSNK